MVVELYVFFVFVVSKMNESLNEGVRDVYGENVCFNDLYIVCDKVVNVICGIIPFSCRLINFVHVSHIACTAYVIIYHWVRVPIIDVYVDVTCYFMMQTPCAKTLFFNN